MRISRTVLPLVLAVAVSAGLVACAPAAVEEDTAPESSETEEAEEEAVEANGDFTAAEWAKPITNPGDLLTSVEGSNFQVDIYQAGTAAATKTGNFVDPETNQPIIAVGADLVYVNYIATNTSSEAIPLSYTLVDVSARYADWPYLQGMDSVTDFDLDAQLQINNGALATGAGDAPFMWEPGTSFSFGQNFLHQAGSPITFTVTLTPADDAGDLVHDEKQEFEAATTIK